MKFKPILFLCFIYSSFLAAQTEKTIPVTAVVVVGDVYSDGSIDISDYIGVANIILTGKP